MHMCFNILTYQYELVYFFLSYVSVYIYVPFGGGTNYSWGLYENSLATPVSLPPLEPYPLIDELKRASFIFSEALR